MSVSSHFDVRCDDCGEDLTTHKEYIQIHLGRDLCHRCYCWDVHGEPPDDENDFTEWCGKVDGSDGLDRMSSRSYECL